MNDVISKFLTGSTPERLKMIIDSANNRALQAFLGPEAYPEYLKLATSLDLEHLGPEAPPNLIFVPGVMGSLLISETRGGFWWLDVRNLGYIDKLGLNPNGKIDADPKNQIKPVTTDLSYDPFLTAVMARDDFGHRIFPFDWRKPLPESNDLLKDLVIKMFEENGKKKVNLVAHSMGGLMVRATLLSHGELIWPKINRIVFIGTPHYGSTSIAGYLKNHLWGFELMALLGLYLSRETFRSLWGVLCMLPAPRGVYPGTRPDDNNPWSGAGPYVHPCANFDMYQVNDWGLGLNPAQESNLQTILAATAKFHQEMYDYHKALDQEYRNRMAVIAGVGYKTLFRLEYKKSFLWDHTAKETERIKGDKHREGDGRVPLASAELENVYIRYIKGVHGGLPNISAVYENVFRWLNNQDMTLAKTPAGALSNHLGSEDVSQAPNLDGTARAGSFTDDPGLWDMQPVAPDRLAEQKDKLEKNQLPEFSRIHLL